MKKQKLKKITKVFIVLDFFAITCLFLIYGPITYFKDLLVTTAMTTMEHQYLARIFYTDSMIEKVLSYNTVMDSGTESDSSHIIFNETPKETYDNIYEEQILKRDKNTIYKLIDISGSGYKGTLVAIYDSKRIKLALASTFGKFGQTLDVISKENGAIIGMNASGFEDEDGIGNGGTVSGVLIQDSKIISNISNTSHGGGIIGFDKNGVLMLSYKNAYEAIQDGMVDGVQFGPFLIVNGKEAKINGNGGMGIHPRTAIAQRKDGIVLFLTIDGRQPTHSIGTSIKEVMNILIKYGAYNAANLDGGASTTLTVEGEIYNKPCGILNGNFAPRNLPNAWIVK